MKRTPHHQGQGYLIDWIDAIIQLISTGSGS